MKQPLVKLDTCGWCGGTTYRDRYTSWMGARYQYRDHVCPPEIEKKKAKTIKADAQKMSAAFNQLLGRVLVKTTNAKRDAHT